MQLTRGQVIILGGALLVVVFFTLIFLGIIPGLRSGGELRGTLTIWGVFDDKDSFDPLIARYKSANPGVEIVYEKKDPVTYERDLLNALAAKNPPDIYMIHNTWIPRFSDKLRPLSTRDLSAETLATLFPEVVLYDFYREEGTYALPLSIDTLALYYNQTLFDQKGIALPPRSWADFLNLVPTLRQLDATGRLVRAAAAIGGSSRTINRAPDLISLLMLQTGTEMTNVEADRASFASSEGLEALSFYIQFAQAQSPYFTWHDSFKNSIDAFADESAAMMFNYSYQARLLRDKNPFLKFKIIPMLQPKDATRDANFANYWGLGVSERAKDHSLAWHFITSVTTDPALAKLYLDEAKRPPALRGLINAYINDPDLGVFARQALTARSWHQGDSLEVDRAFSDMIVGALSGRAPKSALEEAAERVTSSLQRVQ